MTPTPRSVALTALAAVAFSGDPMPGIGGFHKPSRRVKFRRSRKRKQSNRQAMAKASRKRNRR